MRGDVRAALHLRGRRTVDKATGAGTRSDQVSSNEASSYVEATVRSRALWACSRLDSSLLAKGREEAAEREFAAGIKADRDPRRT